MPEAATTLPPKRVVHVLIFARYSMEDGKQIMQDLAFLDAASGDDFHLIMVGYYNQDPRGITFGRVSSVVTIEVGEGKTWYFDGAAFNRQMKLLEEHTTWNYDGGTQLLVIDAQTPDGIPTTIDALVDEKRGRFDWAITIDLQELKKLEIIPSLDHLLQAMRQRMPSATENLDASLTFELSDRLGLKLGKEMVVESLAKAMDLKLGELAKAGAKLAKFRVRDLRK